MRKLKIILLILAIGAVLTGGAFLPGVVAAVMDRITAETVCTASISDLTLEFQEQEAAEGSILDKLCLNAPSETTRGISISDAQTHFSQTEIIEHLKEGLEPYYEAGLIRRMEGEVIEEAWPWLMVDQESGRFLIIWEILLDNPDRDHNVSSVHAALDDETGDILSLSYFCPWEFGAPEIRPLLDSLITIFSEQIGLDAAQAKDSYYKGYGEAAYGFSSESCARRDSYYTPVLGPFYMDFVVYANGFHAHPRK